MTILPSNLRMAVYTAIFNLVDAIATWWLVISPHPTLVFIESNPIMAWLMEIHPAMIFVAKFALLMLGLPFLVYYANRGLKIARYGLAILTVGYLLLACWQGYLVSLALSPV